MNIKMNYAIADGRRMIVLSCADRQWFKLAQLSLYSQKIALAEMLATMLEIAPQAKDIEEIYIYGDFNLNEITVVMSKRYNNRYVKHKEDVAANPPAAEPVKENYMFDMRTVDMSDPDAAAKTIMSAVRAYQEQDENLSTSCNKSKEEYDQETTDMFDEAAADALDDLWSMLSGRGERGLVRGHLEITNADASEGFELDLEWNDDVKATPEN